MFSTLIQSLRTELSARSLQSNLLAGLTVGVIALPLSMALAIASGVAPRIGNPTTCDEVSSRPAVQSRHGQSTLGPASFARSAKME
jgi:hypothetical protein